MTMTNFFITRHGHKTDSYKGIWTGAIDVDLSEKGVKQAQDLGSNLNNLDIKFDLILSSNMKRGKNSVNVIISKLDYTPKTLIFEELKEMSHGDIDGLTEKEFINNYPEILKAWDRDEDPRFPNGENFSDVEKRITPIIDKILKEYEGKNILFVGHKSVNMTLIGYFLKIPYELRYSPQQKMCNLTHFIFKDKKLKLNFLNVNPEDVKNYF